MENIVQRLLAPHIAENKTLRADATALRGEVAELRNENTAFRADHDRELAALRVHYDGEVAELRPEKASLRNENAVLRRGVVGALATNHEFLAQHTSAPLVSYRKHVATAAGRSVSFLRLIQATSDSGHAISWLDNRNSLLAGLPDPSVLLIVSFLSAEDGGRRLACCAKALAWPQGGWRLVLSCVLRQLHDGQAGADPGSHRPHCR